LLLFLPLCFSFYFSFFRFYHCSFLSFLPPFVLFVFYILCLFFILFLQCDHLNLKLNIFQYCLSF
jgi:hypothetical protein